MAEVTGWLVLLTQSTGVSKERQDTGTDSLPVAKHRKKIRPDNKPQRIQPTFLTKSECECGIIWENMISLSQRNKGFHIYLQLSSMDPHKVFTPRKDWLAEQETRGESIPCTGLRGLSSLSCRKGRKPVWKFISFISEELNDGPKAETPVTPRAKVKIDCVWEKENERGDFELRPQ